MYWGIRGKEIDPHAVLVYPNRNPKSHFCYLVNWSTVARLVAGRPIDRSDQSINQSTLAGLVDRLTPDLLY